MIDSGLSQRFESIMTHFNLSKKQMSEACGITRQSLDNLLLGKVRNPSSNILDSLAIKLDINANWILKGEGEMKKRKPVITTESDSLSVQELIKQVNFLQEQLKKKDEQLDKKDEVIKSISEALVKPSANRLFPVLQDRRTAVSVRR